MSDISYHLDRTGLIRFAARDDLKGTRIDAATGTMPDSGWAWAGSGPPDDLPTNAAAVAVMDRLGLDRDKCYLWGI